MSYTHRVFGLSAQKLVDKICQRHSEVLSRLDNRSLALGITAHISCIMLICFWNLTIFIESQSGSRLVSAWIRIQTRVLMTKKNFSNKKYHFIWSKIAIFIWFPWRICKLQKSPALQRERSSPLNMKFPSFFFFWRSFCLSGSGLTHRPNWFQIHPGYKNRWEKGWIMF